jgi:hypothetical protein
MTISTISKGEAIHIASQWHSVMTWSDPGVTMYALSSTGRVQSEDHRNDLLRYIDDECVPIPLKRSKSHKCKKACEPGEKGEDLCPFNDLEQLSDLASYIKHAPIEVCNGKG